MTFQELGFILSAVAGEGLDRGKEFNWFLRLKRPCLPLKSYDFLDDVEIKCLEVVWWRR
jgi:hypothetical protein